jgi:hypothetical protein
MSSSAAPASASRGAGEPISDGYRVVDGSELIGPAFPIGVAYVYDGAPVKDSGFRAFFEVRGQPRDVINGYLEQARELGLTEGTGADSDAGQTSEQVGGARCRHPDLLEGVDAFTCGGFARNRDANNPRSLVLSFARGRVGDASPFSHLEMRYSTTPLYWEIGPLVGGDAGGADGPDTPPAPENLAPSSNMPTLFDGWPPVDPIDVLDGTLPVLQMPNLDCSAFTPLAVLQVTDHPETVIAAYNDQFAAITQEAADIDPPVEVDSGQLYVARASEAGGASYNAYLFDTDQETWLLIESCYD